MEIAVSGKVVVYVSYILMVYFGLEMFGGLEETVEYIEHQTAVIKRNKEVALISVFMGVSVINCWKIYEKIKMDKEKRRALKLDNDLKEIELKNKQNETTKV